MGHRQYSAVRTSLIHDFIVGEGRVWRHSSRPELPQQNTCRQYYTYIYIKSKTYTVHTKSELASYGALKLLSKTHTAAKELVVKSSNITKAQHGYDYGLLFTENYPVYHISPTVQLINAPQEEVFHFVEVVIFL